MLPIYLMGQLAQLGAQGPGRGIYRARDRPDLFADLDDDEFYSRFRFDKAAVRWLSGEFAGNAVVQRHNRQLDPEEKMLLALRFLASNSFHLHNSDLGGVAIGTAYKAAWSVIESIVARAREFIALPSPEQARQSKRDFFLLSGIPDVIGAIDCTHVRLRVGAADKPAFMDRAGHTSLNIQAVSVCDYGCKFLHVNATWPGSCHDSFILNQSSLPNAFTGGGALVDGILLGDSGYGNGRRWILTPVQNPNTDPERRFNAAQKRARVLIENSFGQLKRRFSGLGKELAVMSAGKAQRIVIACMVLHNIAKELHQPDIFGDDDEDDQYPPQLPPPNQNNGPVRNEGRFFRDRIIQNFFT